MKSYKHLYEKFLTDENCYQAIINATKHKGGKRMRYASARELKRNADVNITRLLEYASSFKSFKHIPVEIYDGIQRKKRTIIVPSLKEQVVHHMIVNVMKPIWMRSMYEHSYGSIPNRGGHKGKRVLEKWIRNGGKNCKYCLKMDVKKFFDSIPHSILKEKLSKQIHDKKFLKVLYEVIDVTDKGLPLGFYTSQWLANWYLEELDHFIKEKLQVKYYMRYMDDMVCLGSSKRRLHLVRKAIDEYLREKLGLRLKENWQVYLFSYITKRGTQIGRDIDYMGFRFYRNRTILRRSILLKATRKAKRISKKKTKTIHDCRQMLSYMGWFSCTDAYSQFKRRISPLINVRYLKRRVSFYSKQENAKLCGANPKMAMPLSQRRFS